MIFFLGTSHGLAPVAMMGTRALAASLIIRSISSSMAPLPNSKVDTPAFQTPHTPLFAVRCPLRARAFTSRSAHTAPGDPFARLCRPLA